MKEKKSIVLAVIAAVLFFALMIFYSAYNSAIGYEEQIHTAKSNISIQEKRRLDLITKLVQVVEASKNYESSTQIEIARVRAAAASGNVNQASLVIRAVAEATPDLKATTSFTQLMTELSITENSIAQYRDTYNSSVRDYARFVRRFPANALLPVAGYRIQDFKYLDFNNTEMPSDLFSGG